ncbi:glycoside hydrolase family 76 protein [Corynebacterium sp. 321]|uniref:glycoside hydrolase family 76 protein n=1 Tax=Corynebacterium sp. 321 TaxID=2651047 RepID=UPI0013012328|nr:glycoside hydrolase family 76 protein [Corynebacterium sp. 321]KAB1550812.1 glycoside hydrolase family 76 [Corynebacterium sp. 321]
MHNAKEQWDHRADLSEQAVVDRHLSSLWRIPGTSLGVIAWPPTTRDKLFVRWHYWWQAHLLDNMVDAATRRPTKARLNRIRRQVRGIKVRNLSKLTANHYYDDKAWLALALGRVADMQKLGDPRGRAELIDNIYDGVDSLTGVLPWRTNETFYNTPTNGPAAIIAARNGNLELAETLVDWTFDHLINDDGLVMDGMRMRMHGPEIVTAIHPYCQGVMLGALVELANAQRRAAGVQPGEVSDVGMKHITRAHGLVQAIADTRTTDDGVLHFQTGGGDGGLFNGILVRYLTVVANALASSGHQSDQARAQARQMVLQTAESAWRYRLEIDGLPVFGADWTKDAVMPQSGGLVGSTIAGAVSSSDIAERDMSVQLSGWMLMEAAVKLWD